MADLRDRLKRIRELKKEAPSVNTQNVNNAPQELTRMGWENCGYQVMKREITADSPLNTRKSLPPALAVLVSDLAGRELPRTEDFIFFDLETTGLSGGAGTLAFLAAFGKPLPGGKLRITQYLLLDYPGESDFLEAALSEFKNEKSVIVSYNGKCFDSQILKNRCLMNRIKPPEYRHADLLYPSRRLWKKIIFDCSQGSIETKILGIDRSGDTPGALAPEIWFDFLKTGNSERLLDICDHNRADITGLASIFAAIIKIAASPLESEELKFDIERLALHWRNFLRRQELYAFNENSENSRFNELRITGKEILRFCAEKKFHGASLIYAQEQLKNGSYEEGRNRLLEISKSTFPETIKAAALRTLAIDSERRLKNINEALEFTNLGLELKQINITYQKEFEKRKARLEIKIR